MSVSNLQFGSDPIGLTGYIGAPEEGTGFQLVVLAAKRSGDLSLKPRFGRGTNGTVSFRPIVYQGDIALGGTVTLEQPPEPGDWEGQSKSITFRHGIDQTVTYTITVNTFTVTKNAKAQNLWDFQLTAKVLSRPTYSANWGTQLDSGDVTKSDVRMYEGSSIGFDPHGLYPPQTTFIWDYWGLTSDTDIALVNRLAAMIAANTPAYAGLKNRPASINPDSPDGGVIVLGQNLTDTKDDVLLPRNTFTNDPKHLQSIAHAAAINQAVTNPPIGADAFVMRSQSSVKLNDGKTLNEADFGLLTTQEDVEFPGTFKSIDPSDLESTGAQTNVFNPNEDAVPASIIPAGQRLRTTKIVQINELESGVFRTYAKDSSKEEVEQASTFVFEDPEVLTSKIQEALVDAVPAISGGYISRGLRTSKVTHDHYLNVHEGGLRSTKDDIEMPNTFAQIDPLAIDSAAKTTTVFNGQGAGPGDPPAPSPELQKVFSKTNRENVFKSVQELTWDVLNSEQKRGFPKVETIDDPQNIDDSAVRYKFFTHGGQIPAAPDDPPANNVKIVHTNVLRVTPTKDMALWIYGEKNSRDRLVLDNYETVTDASALTSNAIRSYLDGESVPTTPSGQKLRDTKVVPITDGLTINRTLTILYYGLTTREDDVEMGGTVYTVDQSSNVVAGSARVTVLESDGTPDGGVTVSGLTARDIEKKQRNDNKWEITYIFGQTSHEEDVLFEGTQLEDDKSNLNGSAVVTLTNTSATTYPVALDTPPTIAGETMQLKRVIRKQLTSGSGRYAWRGVYSANTTEQDITFGKSEGQSDGVTTKLETTTIVTSAASTLAAEEATAFAAAKTDAEYAGFSIKQETPGKYVKTIETVKDDKTFHSESLRGYIASTKARPQAGFEVQGSFGNTNAFVHAIVEGPAIAPPGGYSRATLVPIERDRTIGEFKLRRRYSVTIAQLAALRVTWAAIRYKVNSGLFNNSDLFQAKYIGSIIVPGLNIGIDATGTRAVAVDHLFNTDSWMHFNDQNIPIGETYLYTSGSLISNSGFGPASLFDPNATLVWPTADPANFAALLA